MKSRKNKRKGNCLAASYEIITRYMSSDKKARDSLPRELFYMLGRNGEVKLVHGLVFHGETGHHLHAWVEDDLWCYDFSNGNKCIVLKERYYRIGQVSEEKIYTQEEAVSRAKSAGYIEFWGYPEAYQ